MESEVQPPLEQIQLLKKQGELTDANVVPIHRKLKLEDRSPQSVFLNVRRGKYSFMLEGITETTYKDRFVVIGTEPYKVVRTGDNGGDPLAAIEDEVLRLRSVNKHNWGIPEELALADCGAVGYVTYDCVRYFEPRVDPFVAKQKPVLPLPESLWMLFNSMVAVDLYAKEIYVIALCRIDDDSNLEQSFSNAQKRINELTDRIVNGTVPKDGPALPLTSGYKERKEAVSNVGEEGYKKMVTSLKDEIVAGNIIQAVPSQRLAKPTDVHPFDIYLELRALNPSPYMFYFDVDGVQIVGASPERLLRVSKSGVVTSHPIAGTRRRGVTPEEDKQLEVELLSDPKERAEHIQLVDLGRNDVNRICIPKTVKLDRLMCIERYSHVMHIVSNVSGSLREDKTPFDAFRSIFPAGTVSGAPKVRAMELVSSLEKERRGIYAGAIGYCTFGRALDTCIALRTLVYIDGVAYLQAGGGIVYDSDPQAEYEETMHKMRGLAVAVTKAEARLDASSSTNSDVYPLESAKEALDESQASFADGVSTSFGWKVSSGSVSKPPSTGAVLMIDNYDSFTWNLYQYLSLLGANVVVARNDKITIAEIEEMKPSHIVLSPGPGHPVTDSGVCIDVLKTFQGKIPILGVCLGHQAMIEFYGGKVGCCDEVMHGKTSIISHDGKGVYRGVPGSGKGGDGIEVIRYHSLASVGDIPDCLEVVSTTDKGYVMGVRHREYTLEGVQYHPESVKSNYGLELLENFLSLRGGLWSDGDNAKLLSTAEPSAARISTRECIRKLASNETLSLEEIQSSLKEMVDGKATDAQIGAMLSLLPRKVADGLTDDILRGSALTMRGLASDLRINTGGLPLVDIVGTGGDGKDAFNVSTASGFVVAACGCKIAKHGNRSSSGSVGSADFLEALGANIYISAEQTAEVVEKCGFGFLFAQTLHPAMKKVAGIRKEIGIPTVFNLLGPLTSTADPPYQVAGISDPTLGELYARVVEALGRQNHLVVHSSDGMDEVSPSASTHLWKSTNGVVEHRILSQEEFGIAELQQYAAVETLPLVTGGTAQQRADAFREIVEAKADGSPLFNFIVINSSVALVVAGKAKSFKEGADIAKEAIRSGKVKEILEQYISLTQGFSGKNSKQTPQVVREMAAPNSSILQEITARKKKDLEETKAKVSLDSLKQSLSSAPQIIDFSSRLRRAGRLAVLAEIKRASPSRGVIDDSINAAEQALIYANASAAAISVLTEQHWFKGTLEDLSAVREAVASLGVIRPAVLRKDFIFDEYQIYEARSAGADSVLLIVAIMDSAEQLKSLIDCSRSLGMEPLVEVNNENELKTALQSGGRVIGINNRNLNDFSVDLSTTTGLVALAEKMEIEERHRVQFVALSGVKSREDVEYFEKAGVRAVLVGEALMRSTAPSLTIRRLSNVFVPPYVKICGITSIAQAAAALERGADMIGLVFAKSSSRYVSPENASSIVQSIRRLRHKEEIDFCFSRSGDSINGLRRTGLNYSKLEKGIRTAKPLVVGVFADQDAEEVWKIAEQVQLDVIQLSGGAEESLGAHNSQSKYPVIKALHVGGGASAGSVLRGIEEISNGPIFALSTILLDTQSQGARGGTGCAFDWSVAEELSLQHSIPLMLAGGLHPQNIRKAVTQVRPFAVDVSSGVEISPGQKSLELVQCFVREAKSALAPGEWSDRQLDEREVYAAYARNPSNPDFSGVSLRSPFTVDDLLKGWFGEFGGQYAPESLMGALQELERGFYEAMNDPLYRAEVEQLSSHYVGRPTSLYYAQRLTEHCKGAKIWLKREDLNHTGAHKINNALAQALLAIRLGKRRIIAETGAGQHGVATATACAMLKVECIVYMGAEDCRRQSLNVFRMKNMGATVVPVTSGSQTLKDAINEAMRDWITNIETTHYLVGSAIGPNPFPKLVRDYQCLIGVESKRQMFLQAGKLPDAVVACVGGGSNAIGLFHPYIDEPTFIYGVEAGGHGVASGKHSSTVVAGTTGVLHGTRTLLLQDEHGQITETHSISAGLDYPGVGPEHSWIGKSGRGTYVSVDDKEAMEGFLLLSRMEGIVPALESSHALYFGARLAASMNPDQDVLISISGRGDKDMNTVADTLGVTL